ncbi:MAG: hypothetical protein O9282_03950 [Flavobacterium sp.]|jgi:hypothetical protein|uniref:hypothetical protein n=1 Tax=Flavobacterium sp. TaxID=239 RepID=UPI0022C23B89|nr:hypothetical protein [Flavobacterium sp.]MCZ8090506.1 hypothetical protein [Flavobacterium sp.]MCZ8330447.1 hypothetical protein [Flavobacterium sp.]
MNFKDIQRYAEQFMQERNNRSVLEFEGYSPAEMHQILHFTFEDYGPIKIQELTNEDYEKIPLLNQIKFLLNLIDKNKEIKLTEKGFLPTKFVSEIYNQGFLKEEHIEKGIVKLNKELNSITIRLSRLLLELSGLVKKRNGKISLTQKSKEFQDDNHKLLLLILETFSKKFNWAYFDGYGENQIGQLGFGFSMILLSKYGNENQLATFYATKYFNAFPLLQEVQVSEYDTVERYTKDCYSIRTFERFFDYFGVINIETTGSGFNRLTYITKTDLFDKLIKCESPKGIKS